MRFASRWSCARGAFAWALVVAPLGALAVVAACSSTGSTPVVGETPPVEGGVHFPPPPDATLSAVSPDGTAVEGVEAATSDDAAILRVLDIYDIAIDQESTAMLAPAQAAGGEESKPTENKAVADLASRLMEAHRRYTNDRRSLEARTSLAPRTTPESDRLNAQFLADVTKLRMQSGAERDRTYAALTVGTIATEMGLIERSFLRVAKSPELKDALTKLHGDLSGELGDALRVQAALGEQTTKRKQMRDSGNDAVGGGGAGETSGAGAGAGAGGGAGGGAGASSTASTSECGP